DLEDVESISLGYASQYGAVVEVRIGEPLGRKSGEVTLGVTGKEVPGNKPEKWDEASVAIEPMTGRHDVYFYFRKDENYAQDLVRLDWIFYHESDPAYEQTGIPVIEKIRTLESLIPVQTPILQELPPDARRITNVFERGDWRKPGEEVEPGIP